LAKGIKARLIARMGCIQESDQRPIEENLFAFRGRNPVPLPALQDVSLIPLKAYAFTQNVVNRHALYVYAINIQLSRDETLLDAFTDFCSKPFSVTNAPLQPGRAFRCNRPLGNQIDKD
jgi:hypothetical protein